MKKIVSKKDELLKGKKQRITTIVKNKRNKKGKWSKIGKDKSIGVGFAKTYDQFTHQQSLFNYEKYLQIQEKTMQEVIATKKSTRNDKRRLLKYDASLQMQENSLTESIAIMNVRGDVFSSSTIHEWLK